MGYSYRNNGHITDYWPDDDDNTMYLTGDTSLAEITDKIYNKWGDLSFEDVTIESEHIHTRCLTYDLHDPSDYTTFVVIRKRN